MPWVYATCVLARTDEQTIAAAATALADKEPRQKRVERFCLAGNYLLGLLQHW